MRREMAIHLYSFENIHGQFGPSFWLSKFQRMFQKWDNENEPAHCNVDESGPVVREPAVIFRPVFSHGPRNCELETRASVVLPYDPDRK